MPRSVKAGPALTAYLESAKSVDQLYGDVQKHILLKAAHNDRDMSVLHPSEMVKADWCHLAMYHRLRQGPVKKESTTFTRENIFQEGHNTHRKWQRWLAEMDRLAGDWQCLACNNLWWADEVPTDCPSCAAPFACIEYAEVPLNAPILRIGGRSDGYVPHDNALIEIKTLGIGSLRYEIPEFLEKYEVHKDSIRTYDLAGIWKDLRRPLPAAIKQGQIYMYLARHFEDLEVDRMIYFYDFKATQESKSFCVLYDESIAEPFIDAAERIVDCVQDDFPPFCSVNGRQGCKHCKPYEDKE